MIMFRKIIFDYSSLIRHIFLHMSNDAVQDFFYVSSVQQTNILCVDMVRFGMNESLGALAHGCFESMYVAAAILQRATLDALDVQGLFWQHVVFVFT